MSTIATSVGVAFHNARLFEETRQARAAAEDADAAKSSFLSTVSHELRTPLTSVLGFAKIIRRRLEERLFPLIPEGDKKILQTKRQQIILALLEHGTIEKAAASLGLSDVTLWRWLKKPDSQEAYRKARRDAFSRSIARLQHASGTAVSVLLRVMTNPRGHQPDSARASKASRAAEFMVARGTRVWRKSAKLPGKAVQNPTFVAFHRSKALFAKRCCGRASKAPSHDVVNVHRRHALILSV